MKQRFAWFGVLLALCLWIGAQAFAQSNEQVQLTQPPSVQVNGNTATITWSTKVPASATVHYGTDRNNLSQSAEAPWGGTQHSVELKNLNPGTYYYQVTSGEAQGTGTRATSGIGQFTVSGAQGTENSTPRAELLAGPIAQKPTTNGAQIWWETETSAPSLVKYGTSQNNLTQTAQGEPGKSHYVMLNGLQPNTKYWYAVMSSQGAELTTSTFWTLGSQQNASFNITDGPYIERLTPTEAVVAWSTDRRSSSVVLYGTDADSLTQKAEAPWGQTTHRVTVQNLQPDTQYFFLIQTGEAQGTGSEARSAEFQVRTLKQGEQAAIVTPR